VERVIRQILSLGGMREDGTSIEVESKRKGEVVGMHGTGPEHDILFL